MIIKGFNQFIKKLLLSLLTKKAKYSYDRVAYSSKAIIAKLKQQIIIALILSEILKSSLLILFLLPKILYNIHPHALVHPFTLKWLIHNSSTSRYIASITQTVKNIVTSLTYIS